MRDKEKINTRGNYLNLSEIALPPSPTHDSCGCCYRFSGFYRESKIKCHTLSPSHLPRCVVSVLQICIILNLRSHLALLVLILD